ncbi:MAG: hypothetical protein QXY42_04270, partial [Candidatus Bathyarchaeia archaeon]
VEPIAKRLRAIYGNNDEDFANGVLMLIRQLQYRKRNASYPVETLADGYGDCDCFSLLAASIMVAGGLSVILAIYEDHMMIGVHLRNPPTWNRSDYYYWEYGNLRYYVAETTGNDPIRWRQGWRVGELPKDYIGVRAWLIDCKYAKRTAPGSVVAKLKRHLTLFVTTANGLFGTIIQINGEVDPPIYPTLYYRKAGDVYWRSLERLDYWYEGRFKHTWTVDMWGLLSIKAATPETEDFLESESFVITVPVWSLFPYVLPITTISCFVTAILAIFLFWRKKTRPVIPPKEAKPLAEDLNRLKGELISIEGKMERLSDLLLEEKISEETYKELKAEYEERIRTIKSKIGELENRISSELEKLVEEENQLKRRMELLNAKKILDDITMSQFDEEMSKINKRLVEIEEMKRLLRKTF